MSDVTVSIDITAPPDTVWATLEPVERHVDWMADAVAIHFESEQERGVGTTFLCDTKIGPLTLTDRMEITRWEPGAAMGVRHSRHREGLRRVHARTARRRHADDVHVGRIARLPVVPRWAARRRRVRPAAAHARSGDAT